MMTDAQLIAVLDAAMSVGNKLGSAQQVANRMVTSLIAANQIPAGTTVVVSGPPWSFTVTH